LPTDIHNKLCLLKETRFQGPLEKKTVCRRFDMPDIKSKGGATIEEGDTVNTPVSQGSEPDQH
jgi:hypothetical protein